jgi:hypothetical protein
MTRPIGPAVVRAVEHLERTGYALCCAGRPPKGEIREYTGRDLRRAVEYGLAVRSGEQPYIYKPAPGWRDYLEAAPAPMRAAAANSVWNLAKGAV